MTAQDAIFAVTQLIRIGGAIKDLREAKILEADIKVRLERPDAPPDFVEYFLTLQDDVRDQLPDAKQFFVRGGFDRANCPPAVMDAIRQFGREQYFERRRVLSENDDVKQLLELDPSALRTIQHWTDDNAPPSPLRRFGLAIAGIALETAAANPKIFKTGENGQKLISAFLTNVGALLPDGNNPDHFRVSFAERTASILLTAGARVVEENADVIWDQPRLREFGRAVIGPLTKRLNSAIEGTDPTRKAYQLLKINNLRDDLLAPMTHAALGVVAEHQQGFFGDAFATDTALGALTKTFMDTALDEENGGHILRVFSKAGYVSFYQSTLNLVAQKPELFVHGRSAETGIARNMIAKMAGVLGAAETLPPYKGDVAAQVAAAAIEAVSEGLPTIFTSDNPWDQVGVSVLQSIMSGFAVGVGARDKKIIEKVLGREHAVEIVRIIAAQVALTPGMIISNNENPEQANPEVRRIAQHIAELIAQPSANLLSPVMWTEVVGSLLREASANPGKLLSIDDDGPERNLAIHLVADLFNVAADAWTAAGSRRTPSLRLFGETLQDAVSTVARAAVRNAATAISPAGRDAARQLAETLNTMAAEEGRNISDHDWRFLYKTWIAEVIRSGVAPPESELISTLFLHQQSAAGPQGGSEEEREEPAEGEGEQGGGQ